MAEEVMNIFNENSKHKEFLDVLRNNPEAIENQMIKERYKKLLEDIIFNKVNKNIDFTQYSTILKLNILDQTDKEYYLKLLNRVF